MKRLMTDDDIMNLEDNQLRFLPSCRPGYLWLSQLDTEQNYQRPLEKKRVKRMMKAFSRDQLNPIKVNYREGNWCVTDGQHTLELIKSMADGEDVIVFVMCYDSLSYEEEALIFSEQATFSKPLTATDIFNAKLEAGCDAQTYVNLILARHGLHAARYSNDSSNGGILAIGEVMHIYTHMGEDVLDRTFTLIGNCWNYSPESLKRNIIKGISTILYKFDGKFDEEIAIRRWSNISIASINRSAKEKEKKKNSYARALIDEYNQRNSKSRINSDLLL